LLVLIGVLLSFELDRLWCLVAHLHAQALARRRDRQVAIAEPADQVEGLARLLLVREPHRVVRHVLLDRRPHPRRRPEEAVRGHEPLDALVRPLEVVGVDEQPETPRAVGEVREDRPRQKLLPERLPEALHLPECLRVLRAALDVPDALPPQLLLELGLAAPRRVLPSLVGQDLLRRPVVRDPPSQRLEDQHRALMVRDCVAHNEPRVVVHERRQVQALVPAQQEREDVRLPELIRRRPLEAPRRVLARSRRRRRLRQQPLLVQDPPHLCLRDAQRLEPREHVPDAPRPVLGVLLSLRDDRSPARLRHPRLHWLALPGLQRLGATALVQREPVLDCPGARAEHARHLRHACLAAQHGVDHPQPERQRVADARDARLHRRRPVRPVLLPLSASSPHHRSPFRSAARRRRGSVLGD
jgi:hypothetical protein